MCKGPGVAGARAGFVQHGGGRSGPGGGWREGGYCDLRAGHRALIPALTPQEGTGESTPRPARPGTGTGLLRPSRAMVRGHKEPDSTCCVLAVTAAHDSLASHPAPPTRGQQSPSGAGPAALGEAVCAGVELTELGFSPMFASTYVSVLGSTASSASRIFSTGMSSLALLVDSTSFSFLSLPRCLSSCTAAGGRGPVSLQLPRQGPSGAKQHQP